jgi:serine/threonine protein phosphatase PrpC
VALRVAEQAHLSDTGRQRTANEDSFFAGAPVFAVADGMGGAQAGEVASRIAAESFAPAQRGESSPEAFLREIAENANRRIHDLAAEDEAHSGMGTTFTAALLEGDDVSFAHVGDSRAYLFRDGELRLLTSDHSLVEELRRQGKLTSEQAEDHPQRSIITRALGPEREVEVDTMTYRAKPGDVYLLCSDGLTTMVKEDEIGEVLSRSGGLEAAARELVGRANHAGGRDNITVVAFRVEEAEDRAAGDETATLIGPTAADAGLTGEAVREGAERRAPARRREPAATAKRSRGRTALKVLLALLLLAGIGVAAVFGARQVYFLGGDEGGRVAIYRGLPYDLPFGIELYSEVSSSPIQVASLPEEDQRLVVDHELRSENDAQSLIDDLETRVTPTGGQGGGGGQGGAGQQGGGAGGQQGAGQGDGGQGGGAAQGGGGQGSGSGGGGQQGGGN